MTLSIYYINFFSGNNTNLLEESLHTNQLIEKPKELYGAPSCIMFEEKNRSYPFCFESNEIMKQIIKSIKRFYFCYIDINKKHNNGTLDCDFSKIDLTINGPFGEDGPTIDNALKKKESGGKN
jgi:hypothetical protein